MSADPLTELSADDRARLEGVLLEFDLNWTESRLDAAVKKLPAAGPFRSAALREMVKIELERQAARGKQVTVQQYLERYPELAADANLTTGWFEPGSATTTTEVPANPGLAPTIAEQFGRYRIIRLLGRGGMGGVYLAHDTELDRLVALKVPNFSADDDEAAERFTREAKAAATIDHPNVCRVYDVGRLDGQRYITMAYVEGPSLAEVLRSGPLTPRRAAAIVRDVAKALAEAHRRGVVHRDLKPANIMMAPGDTPVVTDFGLAHRPLTGDRRLTAEGVLAGTPPYMSPEQIAGQRAGMASDIYSLGVVLFELTTGRTPFVGSRTAIFTQVLSAERRPPSAICKDVDKQLDAIAVQALARLPDQRFADMTAFATALDDWLRAEPRSSVASARLAPWLFTAALVALVGTVLLFGGAKLGWFGRWDAPPTADPGQPIDEPSAPKLLANGALADATLRPASIACTPDGRHILVGLLLRDHQLTVRSWDWASNQEHALIAPTLVRDWLVFSPDGRRYLAGGSWERCGLFGLSDKAPLVEIRTGPHAKVGAIARNNQRVVVAGESLVAVPFARVHDAGSGAEVGSYAGHREVVHVAALSDDGQWAYSASADQAALWEVKPQSKAALATGQNSDRAAVFVAGTHWCAVGNVHGSITLLDAGKPNEFLFFTDPHKEAITCLVSSPTGKHIVSGSRDGDVRLWDVRTGKEKWRLAEAFGNVVGLAYAPDGRRVIAVNAERAWRLWELPD